MAAPKRRSGLADARERSRLSVEALEPRVLLSAGVSELLAGVQPGCLAVAPTLPGTDTAGFVPLPGDTGETGTRARIFDMFGGTWADAEKDATSTEDDLLCWAATLSNMLEWTGWGMVGGMTRADQFLDYFETHWTDGGQVVAPAAQWWFSGEDTTSGGAYADVAGGGFYPHLDYSDYFAVEEDDADIMSFIDQYTNAGWAMGIWIHNGFSHEVTCWGFNYDPNEPPGSTDYYLGLWITDSDDDKGVANGHTAPNDLHYYGVSWDGSQWHLNDYGGPDVIIEQAVALSRYDNGILTINGDQGSVNQDDGISLRLDAATRTYLEVRVNGTLTHSRLVSSVRELNILGWGGNDTLTVDFTNGDPLAGLTVNYDGGTGGDDALVITGGAGKIGSYRPGPTVGDGTVRVGTSSISFTGLEPVTVGGFAEFTFVTPNSNDAITIDSPAAGQNRISGTSGGVAFESLIFSNVTHFLLDTATNDAPLGNPNDTVTFSSDLVATGLTSFTVDLGPGNDRADASGVTTATRPVTLLGGAGDDTLTGGAGNDRIEGGAGRDGINGGGGFDSLFGGDDSDVFDLSAGSATVDGGGGQDVFTLRDTSGAFQIYRDGSFNPPAARVVGPNNSASLFDVEDVHILPPALDVASSVLVRDLQGTAVQTVILNRALSIFGTVTTNNFSGSIAIEGSGADDTINVANSSSFGSLAIPTVYLPWGLVGIDDFSQDGFSTLTLSGLTGNDAIKVEPTAALATTLIVLDGGAGDDYLSADAVLLGGPGNDTLVGGAGDDTLNGGDGDDTMVGRGGNDTYDGGAGFDTILVEGTPGNDTIFVNQTAATSLTYTVNGAPETDTLVTVAGVRTVEAVRVEAGDGDDTVTVTWADALGVDALVNSLRVDVHGGAAATRDRLAVIDAATGDLVLYRKGEQAGTGSMTIGPANAEPLEMVFDGIEYADPIAGAGGSVVVFKHDPFEYNSLQALATNLGANDTINIDPTIDPGVDPILGLPADVDWFRIVAESSGMLDVQVLFRHIATAPSGRPGLPGNGDLSIELRDPSGDLIASSTSADDDERIRVPAVQGQAYFLRIFGATGFAVNVYNLEVANTPAPLVDAVVLDPTSDTGTSSSDNVTSLATPRVFLEADLSGFNAAGIDILDPAEVLASEAGAAVQVFVNNVAVGYATPVAGTDFTLFEFTLLPGQLSTVFIPAPGGAGLNFIKGAVRVFDGQLPQASGRSQLSQPLRLTYDPTAPAGTVPDMLVSSDTGFDDSDNVTYIDTPAFQGTGEPNSKVFIYAETVGAGVVELVGQGVVLTTGAWEVTIEPLDHDFPVGEYVISAVYEDLAGNRSAGPILDEGLTIWHDSTPPNVPYLDLITEDDKGFSHFDNYTQELTLHFDVTVNDTFDDGNPVPNDVQWFIQDRFENSTTGEVTVASSGGLSTAGFWDDVEITFTDYGVHNLKLVAWDRAGHRSEFLLKVQIDPDACDESVLKLANGQVILYDSDGVMLENSNGFEIVTDVDASDFRIFVDRANNVRRVDLVGNPTGLGMIINPADGGPVEFRDARRPPPDRWSIEALDFLFINASSPSVSIRSPIGGRDLSDILKAEDYLVTDPDLDGDGLTDDLTAFYSAGPVRSFTIRDAYGSVDGDIVIRGADPFGFASQKFTLRRVDIAPDADVVLPDGAIKSFSHTGGAFDADLQVQNILKGTFGGTLSGNITFLSSFTGRVGTTGSVFGGDVTVLGDFLGTLDGKKTPNGSSTLFLTLGTTINGFVSRQPDGLINIFGEDLSFGGIFAVIDVV